MKRSAPMKRSGFKRPEPGAFKTQLDRNTQTLVRTAFKRKARKPKAGDNKRLRDACRNEPCYLRIPGVCMLRDPEETIVPAHRNEDKGIGMKNPDYFTVPACYWCHCEYDQGNRFDRVMKRGFFTTAFGRWEPVRARKMGLEMQEAV